MEHITGLDDTLKAMLENLETQSQEPERQAEHRRRLDQERQEKLSRLLIQSQVPPAYMDKSFENFTVTDQNRRALDACLKYVERWREGRVKEGMALFGDVGVGKSHLAAAVVLYQIREYGVPAIYANVIHTFEMIRWSFNTEEENPLRKLLKTPLLVLDDLGSERPTVWTLEQVSHIIDYRLTNELPIFVTSNALQWAGLSRMLTYEIRGDRGSRGYMRVTVDRIIDRLRNAIGEPVVIQGKSWRSGLVSGN